MYDIPFTDTELICKYLYEHGLPIEPFLSGARTPEGFTPEQVRHFRDDVQMKYAGPRAIYEEDIPIEPGCDLTVRRLVRYLTTQKHKHEYIEFVYLLQGTCREYVGDTEYVMKPGDLFLLAPGTIHRTSSDDDDSLLFYIMLRKSTFENAFLSLLSHDDALSVFFSEIVFKGDVNRSFFFRTGENPVLQQIVYDMYDRSRYNEEIYRRRSKLLFELMCLEIVQHHLTDFRAKNTRSRAFDIISVLRYINENLTVVTVESASSHFGYSRVHMERLIKASTGRTFSDFILHIKMRHAKGLLANPNLSVHEVAENSGFGDDSSFYRAFRKIYGITPSGFRNTLNTNN
ncbi:MAG: helix-turn-helix domain-containing protein [Lachnospiraceae bacterium]|nr:helix-turn-helix domain-containing protein [Lachnospiraceae bacterium]